jgi:transposase
MKFKTFIGIDVSKETLDICILQGAIVKEERIKNSGKEIKKFFRQIQGIVDETLICMEHTGIYNNLLLDYFQRQKMNVWVESARQIKLSLGTLRGKSDRLDAKRIAYYCCRNQDVAKLWNPTREVILKLKMLLKTRDRLTKVKNQLSTAVKESRRFIDKKTYKLNEALHKKPLLEIQKAIKNVDEELKMLIGADQHISHLYKLVKSVEGIGSIVATNIIVKTNEFKNYTDPRKFACHAGVAPFEHTSGKSIRGKSKVSHMADKSLKKLLHLAAMSVIKKGELAEFYNRKIQSGKNKMSVINAVRNKIIARVFAVVKRNSPYMKFNNFVLD